MSAFILSKPHIDTLSNAAVQLLVVKPLRAEELGQVLWDENYRSVNFRYREDTETPDYIRDVFDAPFHPIAILKAIDCYEYQSCECSDFEETSAFAWTGLMRVAAMEKVSVSDYHRTSIYDDTPWGIEDMRDVPIYTKENA